MAWPYPFRANDRNIHECYGIKFRWTEYHLTSEQLQPMKYTYDVLGEQALEILNGISPPPRSALPRNSGKYSEPQQKDGGKSDKPPEASPKRDLYNILREHASNDKKLAELWEESNTVPPWVDWDQIGRGQDVFYRYGGPSLTGLAFQSLLGGMGAFRVVEVLVRTGGFSTKVARHRLFETTQLILQTTRSLESIKPGGDGHASCIRVRLLHAAVRQRIMKLAASRPSYYDVEKLGVPINDLDSIATIGTFSAMLIWLSLPRQGIWMRQQEIIDYLALWRYIAYLCGTPTEYFETPEKSKAIMESLLINELKPSHTSRILASNVIASLQGQPPGFASKDFLEASARWLNGNELCDDLGLGRPGLYYWLLMAGQCLFFMTICYTYRSIPYLDRRKIKTLRHVFWKVIVEAKHGLGEETIFDYKYIPDYQKMTEKEDAEMSGVRLPGVERRNLQTFVLGCGFLGVMGWAGTKILMALVS